MPRTSQHSERPGAGDGERRGSLTAAFAARFGRDPTHWVRAPGRVDAMGSHTDYNEGFVLALAIDRDTWIAAAPRSDRRVRVASLNLEGEAEFPLDVRTPQRVGGWPIYVRAVAVMLAREGFALTGFDALVHGTLPIASGLSSSASLEVAAALLLSELGGWEIEPLALARLCQRAENEIVGVRCGILDPYTSIFAEAGSALLLDCRHLTHERVDIPEDLVPVICDTRARRTLTGSEYGERRASCEAGVAALAARLAGVTALRDVGIDAFRAHEAELPEPVARRCRFAIEESARVVDLARALRAGDRGAIARLCDASFAGARDGFEITIPAMEAMHAAMKGAPGVVGARQAGAGFGGCMLALVDAARVEEFAEATARGHERATGVRPQIDPVRPAPGAGPLTAK